MVLCLVVHKRRTNTANGPIVHSTSSTHLILISSGFLDGTDPTPLLAPSEQPRGCLSFLPSKFLQTSESVLLELLEDPAGYPQFMGTKPTRPDAHAKLL